MVIWTSINRRPLFFGKGDFPFMEWSTRASDPMARFVQTDPISGQFFSHSRQCHHLESTLHLTTNKTQVLMGQTTITRRFQVANSFQQPHVLSGEFAEQRWSPLLGLDSPQPQLQNPGLQLSIRHQTAMRSRCAIHGIPRLLR